MKINVAHHRERSTTGGWIDFVVFDAKATNGDNDNLLAQLTMSARNAGLKVDQAALAFNSAGRLRFYGTRSLVDHLAGIGLPRWTHTIDF